VLRHEDDRTREHSEVEAGARDEEAPALGARDRVRPRVGHAHERGEAGRRGAAAACALGGDELRAEEAPVVSERGRRGVGGELEARGVLGRAAVVAEGALGLPRGTLRARREGARAAAAGGRGRGSGAGGWGECGERRASGACAAFSGVL
jgi:hypothetical protein